MRTKGIVKYYTFLVSLSLTQANIMSLCGTSDSYWEVREGKQDNTFTCTGLSAQDTVTWILRGVTSVDTDVGSCPPRPSNGSEPVCEMSYFPVFKPRRISNEASIMIVNTTVNSVTTWFEKGQLICSVFGSADAPAGCRLDYIYSPENISCTVQFRNDSWTVFGQCDIKKTRSSQKRYRCEWTQANGLTKEEILLANSSMVVLPPNGAYVNGTCNFTSYLPPDGQYTYRVTVVPGEGIVNASSIGSNEIRRPSNKTFHNCPQYVREGDSLSCTCSVHDLGIPPGFLQWNSTLSTLLTLSNVKPTDSKTHICQLLWNNSLVQFEKYTLNVAYGPNTVSPIVVSPQPFDTDGAQKMTLNCSVSESNPPASVTWVTSVDKTVVCSSQLCVFTPKIPDDDGVNLQCQARNPVTNITKSSNLTVALNYPPNSSLMITGSPNLTNIIYEGDNLTLSCTVNGGKPVNATVITFGCPNKTDTPDSFNSSSITSSLMFLPVKSENHGSCVCKSRWKESNWYDKTVSWNITVYSPPSVPRIFPMNDTRGQEYPFMAGTSGILGCQSNQLGRPEATFSWPVSAAGHTSGSNLTFYNLSREDNGRTVKCRASNSYTENRWPVDDATFILQVYYEPVVSFTHISEGNDCVEVSMESGYKHCVVAEGQRVHINCTADSNPQPASFKWLSPNKEVYSNMSELVITSADHLIHHGNYTCTVVTKQNGDRRLPLASSAILTVTVGYASSIVKFSINHQDNATVNVEEKSRVEMKCLCKGRPTPSIRLINSAQTEQLLNQTYPKGDISDDENTEEASFSIDQVLCEASGVYRCDVNNSLGQGSENRTLLVSCAPRKTSSEEAAPNIITNNGKGELTFKMTSHPVPEVKKITYLGTNETLDEYPVRSGIVVVELSFNYLAPAGVVCNIRVVNLTNSDEGFYRILFGNSLGEFPFTFYVKVSGGIDEKHVRGEDLSTPAIIGGVCSALLAVIIITITVVLWKRWRRRSGPRNSRTDSHQKVQGNKTSDDGEIIINSIYGRSGDFDAAAMVDNDMYAGSDHVEQVKASVGKGRNTGIGEASRTNKNKKNKKKVESPLSKDSSEASAYENVAFQTSETEYGNSSDNLNKEEETNNAVQRNQDGLIYLSLNFDEAKSAKPPPPRPEETEYVSIDLQKTASLQHNVNNS